MQMQLCDSLPSNIVIGKTRVVLIFWKHMHLGAPDALTDYNQNPGTDAIWVTH